MAFATLAQVKRRLFNDVSVTDFDDLLNDIIPESDERILSKITPRQIAQAAFTEYCDGEGREDLPLMQGPLVSVSQVDLVSQTDAGEQATTVDTWLYALEHLQADGSRAQGNLRYLGGVWTRGVRNYKVAYTAGFASTPVDVQRLSVVLTVQEFLQRESHGLASKIIGDGTLNLLSPKQIEDYVERVLRPYMPAGAR